MTDAAFHPEDIARAAIDRRLVICGWVVQSRSDMNVGSGQGIAVREFQTASGPVDYALFVDRRLCGVIEAKPEGRTLSGFPVQAERYMAGAPEYLVREAGQVRFEYVASPTEILFRDHADPAPVSRRVFAFHRPATLSRWLKEPGTLRRQLQSMPPLNREGLRDCQVEATNAVEASLARNHPRALVQMATGAGKTFTAATLSYRLLAHAGFRRILFLADRANLVRQTRDEYLAYRPPETGRSFAELYNVQKLGPAGLDAGAQVVVATIQRVYAALTGARKNLRSSAARRARRSRPTIGKSRLRASTSSSPTNAIARSTEHGGRCSTILTPSSSASPRRRHYTRWATSIGIWSRNILTSVRWSTASTLDLEVFRIRTEIGERGATVKAGYDLPVRDKRTRAERYETLTEDFSYAPSDLDKTVIAPNQIRTVIEAYRDSLFTELFPGRREVPKTLVFAKDDHHAEEIVGIVRDVFGKGNDFAKKITYRADGGDPDLLIRQFRNDFNPRIAVTVDMIATGTDVKPIEALIFLRDVKASQYFEQMKGRGARTIAPEKLREVTPDAEAKTRFVLIDAVGVTESLKSVSQPLDRDRKIAFEKLIEQIAAGRRDEDAFATLAARLAALDRRIGDRDRSRIAMQAGLDPAGLAARLLDAVDPDTLARRVPRDAPEAVQTRERIAAMDEAARVFDDPALRRLLVEVKQAADIRIDSITTDAVVSSGWDAKKAGEEIERFKRFLDEKRDELLALQILYRLPHVQRRLTYQALDDLRDAMRRPPWLLQPPDIWRAYKRLAADKVRGNPANTLADIVMLVRYAIGEAETLEPLPALVAGRFNLWLGREERAGRLYSDEQKVWLAAIRDHLAVNVEATIDDLSDAPNLSARGGLLRARYVRGPLAEAARRIERRARRVNER